MKKIVYLFLILVAFSCKSEEKSKKNELLKDDLFKVIIEAIVKEDDKFQLFYVDDSPESGFSPNERLVFNIKGSDNPQIIQFICPKNVFPYKFRLDLGENNFETIVEINEIKLQFNNEKITIGKFVIDRFFQPNIYLEKREDGFLRKTVDGRCDPFLLSTPLLNKKMELEL